MEFTTKHKLSKPAHGPRPSNTMAKALHLTAHDRPEYRGYHVRIGKVASLFFSSRRYGSDDNAFEAAVKYRDKVLVLLGESKRAYRGVFTSKRNSTGYIGVSFENDEAYVAQWVEAGTGQHKKKWFSIGKYGKERALKLAIEARSAEVGEYPQEILDQIQLITDQVRKERAKL